MRDLTNILFYNLDQYTHTLCQILSKPKVVFLRRTKPINWPTMKNNCIWLYKYVSLFTEVLLVAILPKANRNPCSFAKSIQIPPNFRDKSCDLSLCKSLHKACIVQNRFLIGMEWYSIYNTKTSIMSICLQKIYFSHQSVPV